MGPGISPTVVTLIACALALVVGLLIGYIYRKSVSEKLKGNAEQTARNMILDAEKKAEGIEKKITGDAKDEARRIRNDAEREVKERKNEVRRQEQRIQQKEDSIDKKLENIERKEESINKQQQEIANKKKEIDSFLEKKIVELEKVSGLSAEEAKQILLEEMEREVRHDASLMIKEIESQAKEEAESKARDIIVGAIQRYAADQVAESTVSVVSLPNDEMKGRIIGREGRNIRAIETQTGVDLIIDDTPEAVIISGFDPVRREIARLSLERLIADGRIHPARIEEMVKKSEAEVNKIIKEQGESATFEADIHNLHPELIKLLGRLHYRTSYGQNVLKHSLEVAHLAGLMASELGLNVKLAKRAGLLHDIGKAFPHEQEGTHVDLGVSVLTKYKEADDVINGVAAHHGDYEAETPEAVLVAAADALSAARPGARRDTLDVYIKRLEKLEELANTTPGVEKSFAIQAGREIRIIANPNEVGDDSIELLARDIAKKVETEMEYPGQIKINVVRETRAIDYAK